MSTAPFPVDPVLTGIALAYENNALIADSVLPRLDPPLEKEEFTWLKFALGEEYTIPDTKVGRKSAPSEVEFSATRQTGRTQDYGLDDLIPYNDNRNAPLGYDPISFATEQLAELIALDRERRVANLVFQNALYAAANKVTLSGTSQWSDFTNSNPISDILTGLDATIMRPNVAVMGRAVYTKLAQHPKIVKAYFGNAGDSGVVPRSFLAQLFELDEVLVGESFVNTAKKGQTPTVARCWGKSMLLFKRNPLARNETNTVTFGYTAQYGQRVAGQIDEPKVGLRGATRVRVGESVQEVISGAEVAYYIENAVA
jgi:hypothetical protein